MKKTQRCRTMTNSCIVTGMTHAFLAATSCCLMCIYMAGSRLLVVVHGDTNYLLLCLTGDINCQAVVH